MKQKRRQGKSLPPEYAMINYDYLISSVSMPYCWKNIFPTLLSTPLLTFLMILSILAELFSVMPVLFGVANSTVATMTSWDYLIDSFSVLKSNPRTGISLRKGNPATLRTVSVRRRPPMTNS